MVATSCSMVLVKALDGVPQGVEKRVARITSFVKSKWIGSNRSYSVIIPIQEFSDISTKQSFETIDELLAFIDRVQANNHETLGRWTAAQNFFHLAAAFDGSLQRLPNGYPRMVRLLVRPFRSIVTRYRFPPWLPIPASIRSRLEPPDDARFDEQKTRLVDAIREFNSHVGMHPPHPVLGELTREEWFGFHLRHSSHHLSFIRLVESQDVKGDEGLLGVR